MTKAEEAWQFALDRLVTAEERLRFVSAAAWDISDGLGAEDVVERLEHLDDAIMMTRRALSQASAWIETAIDHLEREPPDDDPCACGECEGEGPALQVA